MDYLIIICRHTETQNNLYFLITFEIVLPLRPMSCLSVISGLAPPVSCSLLWLAKPQSSLKIASRLRDLRLIPVHYFLLASRFFFSGTRGERSSNAATARLHRGVCMKGPVYTVGECECAFGTLGAADLALVVLLEPQAQANEAALLQRRQITKVTSDVVGVQLVCSAKGSKAC